MSRVYSFFGIKLLSAMVIVYTIALSISVIAYAQGKPNPIPVPTEDRLDIAGLVKIARLTPVKVYTASGLCFEGRLMTASDEKVVIEKGGDITTIKTSQIDAVTRREVKKDE